MQPMTIWTVNHPCLMFLGSLIRKLTSSRNDVVSFIDSKKDSFQANDKDAWLSQKPLFYLSVSCISVSVDRYQLYIYEYCISVTFALLLPFAFFDAVSNLNFAFISYQKLKVFQKPLLFILKLLYKEKKSFSALRHFDRMIIIISVCVWS